LYGQNDPEVGIGSGLSDIEAGMRLRYEIRRQFAPYIGVNWTRLFGNTADFANIAGRDTSEAQLVIGLRAWF
jgi:copper resistance protein B